MANVSTEKGRGISEGGSSRRALLLAAAAAGGILGAEAVRERRLVEGFVEAGLLRVFAWREARAQEAGGEGNAKGKPDVPPKGIGTVKAELPHSPGTKDPSASTTPGAPAAVSSADKTWGKLPDYRYTAPDVRMVLDIWIQEDMSVPEKDRKVHAKIASEGEPDLEFKIPQNLVKLFGDNPKYGKTRKARLAFIARIIFAKPIMYKVIPEALEEQLNGRLKSIQRGEDSLKKVKE
jgi:hypothetical protein